MTQTLPVLSAQSVREAEDRFPQQLHDGTLMQRAAHAVAGRSLALLRQQGRVVGRRVLLLVGGGDNGADALFAGAVLARRGVHVLALPVAGSMHDAAAQAFRGSGGRILDLDSALGQLHLIDLVVDGIVGLGSTRPLEGDAGFMVRAVTDAQLPTLAIDVPSGVHSDTGAVTGVAVRADVTVTFGALRRAHVLAPAALHCGRVFVADIGVPMTSEDVAVLSAEPWFGAPAADADKYSRGVVGLVTGSPRYPGAGTLSVGAALRSGSGLVRYYGAAADAVVVAHPEVVAAGSAQIGTARCHAWVVGCGAGTDEEASTVLAEVLLQPSPVVVDADAITLLARDRHVRELLVNRAAQAWLTLVTPHAGELDRLAQGMGLFVDVEQDRLGAVQAVAAGLRAVVLLKGPTTVIANGATFVATMPLGAQLATAGSGDVLAGLLGGAIARWEATAGLTESRMMLLAGACAVRHSEAAGVRDTVASDLVVGLEHLQSATMTP